MRVDLIAHLAKFKLSSLCKRHIHPKRFEAQSLLKRIKEMDEDLWEELYDLFLDYLDDVDSRIIVLKHRLDPKFLLLGYKHRFTKRRLLEIKERFERAWDELSKGHSYGVYWTLTIDISKYDSLYEASVQASKAFNRLMSWVRRTLNFRPKYICIIEFQDNGRIHYHVIMFGIKRIADKFAKLTPELEKVGFGKINWIYQLRRTKKGKWVWSRHRPRGSRLNPKDYLMKYLIKALRAPRDCADLDVQDMKIAMYWATNKRFFTCSRLSRSDGGLELRGEGEYFFIGSFTILDIPMEIVELSVNPWMFYLKAGVMEAPSLEYRPRSMN